MTDEQKPDAKPRVKTGRALLDFLEETGTGPSKLKIGLEALQKNADATAVNVAEHMRSRGVNEVTLGKCKDFIEHVIERMRAHLGEKSPL